MPKAVVEDATRLGAVPPSSGVCTDCGEIFEGKHACASTITPAQALGVPEQPSGMLALLMAPLRNGHLGTREEIQRELDGIAAAVSLFPRKQPDQVMKECAAYSARLTELMVLLHRVESTDRQYTRVRTQQVDRWAAQLEFQFRVASRLVEVMRQDLALLGGQ